MKTMRKPIATARTPKRRLAVSSRQSADLVKLATMLEVRPKDFLGWIMGDLIGDFSSPSHGLLLDWAKDQIAYGNPETAERVQARVSAWLGARRKYEDLSDGEEGGKS